MPLVNSAAFARMAAAGSIRFFWKFPVPSAHFIPSLEAADLHVRRRKPTERCLGLFSLVVLRLLGVFQLGVSPPIDAGTRLRGDRLRSLRSLYLHRARFGHFNLHTLTQND